jgi:antitoxin HigA-1
MSRKLKNIHPGEILREEFLEPMGITAYRLAKDIDVPQPRIYDIIRERRSVTPETALKLDRYFGLSEGFWIGLQSDYDMAEYKDAHQKELDAIIPLARSLPAASAHL